MYFSFVVIKFVIRTLSEYLGLDNMLAIVCKTLEGVQALEQYEKDGSIDRNTGLHGVAPTIGRTMKGRFHVFCLQNMRPFVGEFISDDPQKKLALLNPRLPNGKLPPGFLGFAVNMISVDDMHLSCVTFDGYGLRETLFFNLFSRLQVYKSRSEMLCAQPFITDGAVSLDGGMIKGCGLFCLGDRNDVEIKFPIADAKPSMPKEVSEIEQQIKLMDWKKEMLSSDILREESLLNSAKCLLKAKSDEYRKLINEELLIKGRNSSPRPINTGFLLHDDARRQ
ncbi:protein DEFECTIVE IN MERISTEM SILENCING 3-like [Phalaenopsis equestris]|uniref:protein DEFECTIVE IN MERISTEM SILENCING 3-like n=1 Tax=Phalaenopsis equestris TaxID=78828 RepID=UPI0009E193E8|nr:protein DEFECTIVE IN MERISTEM SILENCING 3-like [Phalaenopsis equestris]